jgi:hypothetical protein
MAGYTHTDRGQTDRRGTHIQTGDTQTDGRHTDRHRRGTHIQTGDTSTDGVWGTRTDGYHICHVTPQIPHWTLLPCVVGAYQYRVVGVNEFKRCLFVGDIDILFSSISSGAYAHACVSKCVCARVCVRVCKCAHVCVRACLCTCVYIRTHVYVRACLLVTSTYPYPLSLH